MTSPDCWPQSPPPWITGNSRLLWLNFRVGAERKSPRLSVFFHDGRNSGKFRPARTKQRTFPVQPAVPQIALRAILTYNACLALAALCPHWIVPPAADGFARALGITIHIDEVSNQC